MNNLLAQEIKINGQTIKGPTQQFNGDPINTPADLINQIMPFLYGLGAIILFFVFVLGGFDLILSRGDPAKMKSAKAKITTGIVGVVLLSLAYLVTRLISQIFNIGDGIF